LFTTFRSDLPLSLPTPDPGIWSWARRLPSSLRKTAASWCSRW